VVGLLVVIGVLVVVGLLVVVVLLALVVEELLVEAVLSDEPQAVNRSAQARANAKGAKIFLTIRGSSP
jgi:hypothetical protein